MNETTMPWQSMPLFAIRLATVAAAAVAVTWGVAGPLGVGAALLGASAGSVAGQILGQSRIRLGVAVVVAVVVGALAAAVEHVAVGSAAMVRVLGPTTALDLSAVARFGGYAAALSLLVRVLAVRVPALVGVELLLVAAAVVIPLAPHREGVVARPLWLSDWAWHHGFDPVDVLLAIGGGVALLLGALLMARTDNRVSLVSWLSLAALIALGVSIIDVGGLPQPKAGNDLGLTGDEEGDPPLPTDGGPWNGPGRTNQPQDPSHGPGQEPRSGEPNDGGQPDQSKGGGQGGQRDRDGERGRGQSDPPQEGQGGKPERREANVEDQQGEGTPAPMALVLFGDDYIPPGPGYYFRQDIWSHFNGSRLVASRRSDVDRDVLTSFPAAERTVQDPPPTEGRTEVHAKVFLTVKHKRPFALESLSTMAPERNPDASRFVRAFKTLSWAQVAEYAALLGHDAGAAAWSDDVRAYYTVTPDDDRYRELADRIVADLKPEAREDAFAQAVAIKLWLDDNVTYSTSERHAGAADPAAEFLFGNQIGYCVHIAHAAVYLWRSRGLPARVATGYMATVDNLKGSALVLRGSNAHAWPELYLEGVGWVIIDITPKNTLDQQPPPADDALAEQLANIARGEGDEEAVPKSEVPTDTERGPSLPPLFFGALGAVLAVLYAIKLWRRVAPVWTRGRHLPRVAYRRALDQLGESGMVRRFGETRMAFAARVGQTVPSLRTLAALSETARLGKPAPTLRERPEFSRPPWSAALQALSADLRANVPRSRRVLGLLNPIIPWQIR